MNEERSTSTAYFGIHITPEPVITTKTNAFAVFNRNIFIRNISKLSFLGAKFLLKFSEKILIKKPNSGSLIENLSKKNRESNLPSFFSTNFLQQYLVSPRNFF